MTNKRILNNINPSEAAKSFVFTEELSKDQRKLASEQLREARKKTKAQASERDILTAKLMQLKFQLEDYLSNREFESNRRFGYFLKSYLAILGKKRIDFAREIDVHETFLSQLINGRRKPNDNIIIRLELHSNKCIPAEYWFRVVEKERIFEIKTNRQLRNEERVHVSNKIPVSI